MRLSFRSLFALASVLTLAAGASAQFSGLQTNLRTEASVSDGPHVFDSQDLGPSAGPTLDGYCHSESVGDDGSGEATGQVHASFGDLSVDMSGHAEKNKLDGAANSYVSHGGAPSVRYFDRILVTGPVVGTPVTIHMEGHLTDLYRVEGDHVDSGRQGVEGGIYLNGNPSPYVDATSYRAGTSVYEDHAGTATYRTAVGDTFDIDVRLYGDAEASDVLYRSGVYSVDALTQGRFLTTFTTDASGVSLIGDSGHVYQAVPEPAPLAALGLGALALLRRSRRN